jgi:hypothetical protein
VTIGPAGAQGKTWRDLAIEFSVEKNGSSTPNAVKLTIYNLGPDSRTFVEKRKQRLVIVAGYESGVRTICNAEVDRAEHRREGSEWVTTIEAADGLTAYGNVVHDILGPKSTDKDAVAAIAKGLGIDLGDLKGIDDKKPYGHGRALSGPAKNELDYICRRRKLRWSIQDGALLIYPIGGTTDAQAIVLSPATGLIGSPERTEAGYKLRSLLQGQITPGRRIKVDSEGVEGFFVAEKVTHTGQSHGNDWYTDIEAIRLP